MENKMGKRVVIKLGTSTLTHKTGRLNIRRVEKLVKIIADIQNAGNQVILVSSGSIGLGMAKLGLLERPGDTPTKQACAAVGQCELMYLYDKQFSEYSITVAQLLLTKYVLLEDRRKNVENALENTQAERKELMSNWEKNVRKVVPYVPGEQPHEADMIKLNTNENPYPPSPKAAEAIRRVAEEDTLRLYPDPTAAELVQAIADVYHVSTKQVFVGVGSDDVLAMAFMTYFNSDKPILFPDITYSFYDVWAEEFRIPYEQIPLDENFCIVPEQYFAENHPNGGIVFPNPNAPTGVELSLSAIESILQHNPDVVVIVDEAYVDFGAATAQPLLEKYENLLVVQTTSKSRSLAGMRIGYAIGNEKMISYLNDVKYSFNSYTMNQTTIAAGAAAIRDVEYFRKTVKKVMETREWSKEELKKLGFSFEDSKSNFIFATHKSVPAGKIFQALRERHIYVRYFEKPRIDNYLRITIGTREEMQTLFDFLKDYLTESSK